MSGSSIPHLSTLRPRGGGLRGRANRRGGRNGAGEPPAPEQTAAEHDATIQGTDNDAASSRASAVNLGYLTDPYAAVFSVIPPPRRYPLINRGTYVRTTALDHLIEGFLSTTSSPADSKKQIISLGAGSDTRFFRLIKQFPDLVYHELDFASNTSPKISKIQEILKLKTLLPDFTVSEDKSSLSSPTLNIHALDLRHLTSLQSLPNLAQRPTLIISECCLTYLPVAASNAILSHLLTLLGSSPAGIVQYDPIKPLTPFGRTMVSNLSSRGISMPSLHSLPTLEFHRARLNDLGLQAGARTVAQIYSSNDWIAADERARVERLEWLDEVEEWDLLAAQYCIIWGWRGPILESAWSSIDGAWREDERRDDTLHAGSTGTPS